MENSRNGSLQELSSVLDEELRNLPERYRLPLLLCYLEGRTRDQAAQQMGWSLRTLHRRLERGLALLRKADGTRSDALQCFGICGTGPADRLGPSLRDAVTRHSPRLPGFLSPCERGSIASRCPGGGRIEEHGGRQGKNDAHFAVSGWRDRNRHWRADPAPGGCDAG